MVQLCEKTYLLSQAQVRYILRKALQSFLLAENFAAKTCNTRQKKKNTMPRAPRTRPFSAAKSPQGTKKDIWPLVVVPLKERCIPSGHTFQRLWLPVRSQSRFAGGRGFQREGFPRSQLRHLAQKESGMRTAGYRVALLLATVVVSGSALPASGRRRQRSDLSGAHGPGNS